jgi:hypothetical protein
VVARNWTACRLGGGLATPYRRLGSLAPPFGVVTSAHPGHGLPEDKTFEDTTVLIIVFGDWLASIELETYFFKAKLDNHTSSILDLTQSFGNNAHVSSIKIYVELVCVTIALPQNHLSCNQE